MAGLSCLHSKTEDETENWMSHPRLSLAQLWMLLVFSCLNPLGSEVGLIPFNMAFFILLALLFLPDLQSQKLGLVCPRSRSPPCPEAVLQELAFWHFLHCLI